MFTVSINGKDYASEQDKPLLRFLRDDLHLTAAKDGCSEGVCGELCMIPAAPACAAAYYRFDGEFRQSLPLAHTPYRKD